MPSEVVPEDDAFQVLALCSGEEGVPLAEAAVQVNGLGSAPPVPSLVQGALVHFLAQLPVKVVPAASAAALTRCLQRMTTVPDDPVDLQSWANALPWSHQATIVALVTFFSEGTAAGPGDRDEHRARLCEIVGRAIMPDALLPGPYFAYLIKHNETIFSGVRESLGLMARALSWLKA